MAFWVGQRIVRYERSDVAQLGGFGFDEGAAGGHAVKNVGDADGGAVGRTSGLGGDEFATGKFDAHALGGVGSFGFEDQARDGGIVFGCGKYRGAGSPEESQANGPHQSCSRRRSEQDANVFDGAHPAANGQRHEAGFGGTLHHVEHDVAILVARGDVKKGEFVGARGVISDGRFHRIAGVAQIDEVDALDDPAVFHVEAGNDADLEHR